MNQKKLNKILYIEDEADIAAIAQLALEEIGGYQLKCCSSGSEAIKCAPEFKPDLFLIDVMMPEMDGPTTYNRIRELSEFAATPVIFLTAKTQTNEIDKLLELGALDVITKPFDPLTLSTMIEQSWGKQ